MADVRSLMLWLLLIGSATAFSTNYQKTFGDDWDDAVRFVKDHHEEWQQEFDLFDVDSRVAEAIVFRTHPLFHVAGRDRACCRQWPLCHEG